MKNILKILFLTVLIALSCRKNIEPDNVDPPIIEVPDTTVVTPPDSTSTEPGDTTAPGPEISIIPQYESMYVNGDGGYFNLLYMSDADLEVTMSDDWIRLVDHNTTQGKVSFEILRNKEYEKRTGYIILRNITEDDTVPLIEVKISIYQDKKIDHPALSFEEGTTLGLSSMETYQLSPIFTDMPEHQLTWTSSNKNVVSVSHSGVLTPTSNGKCRITASSSTYNVTAHIDVEVRLKAESMKIMLGDQDTEENPVAVRFVEEVLEAKAVFEPEYGYSDDVSLYSTDESIASIEGMKIHCNKVGTVTIYAESLYHGLQTHFTLIIIDL